MSRINTNVQSLIAQRVLGMNNKALSTSLERLSTGLRINRGKDDPAGLIASEVLRSEIKAIGAAIGNAERADQVVNIAEGGLGEISNLLTELQGLVTSSANSAGLSKEEKEANQLQIDSILQTIDRISSATSFQGQKLLNGNFDYQVSGVAAGVTDFRINGAKFESGSLTVNVLVTQSAQQAGLYLSMGGTTIDLSAGTSFTIEVTGSLGSRELTFTSGTTLVERIINTHPEARGAGEVIFLQRLISDMPLTIQSDQPYPQCVLDMDENDADRMAKGYLNDLRLFARGVQRVTDKNLLNWRHLGLISCLFPKARVIHCHRNPLDTCFSCFTSSLFNLTCPWASDLKWIGLVYGEYRRLMDHWQSVLEIQILDVSYEELIQNQ